MPKPSSDHPVLRAASLWRDRCLRSDGSVFTDKTLWTADNVAHLVRHFAENLYEGEGSFFEKLRIQLESAPASAKQLAAEMLWVMYLYPDPSSMRPETKHQQIRRVWEWSGEPLPDARFELDETLEPGIGNPGTAYNTYKWKELLFLIRLIEAWKGMSEAQRAARLADHWKFAELLEERDETRRRQLRHILLYVLFPERFEPFASPTQKNMIVKAFTRDFGEDPTRFTYDDRVAMDRQILVIRDRLQAEGAAPDFDFNDNPYLAVWQPPLPPPPSARVWVISAGTRAIQWDEAHRKGIIAIGWDKLGDLGAFTDRQSVHEHFKDTCGGANPTTHSLACYQFAHEMQRGDRVIVKQGTRLLLGHGVIESDYEFDQARHEFRHVRGVKWVKAGHWRIPKSRKVTGKTLTDFSHYKEWLRFAFGLMEEPDPPFTRRQALRDLFLPESDFDDITDALERKKNVVLEGPPGVGKTFVAKRLAYLVIGYEAPERVRMIQFHQSYAYEDFIQGYRPREDGGFELRNGVFFSFCRKAVANPDKRYVFIIDEVNRGNLSKIFGELMMLIEADKRSPEYAVPLTYSPEDEPFHVPRNLYLIGMMNTADRSLAMVDYALRRRFSVHRLRPAFRTKQFREFLDAKGVAEELVAKITNRLSALNKEIRDDRANLGPGFEIGHSFFCPGDGDEEYDESWYEAIIRREIAPLLREYWFERPDHVEGEVNALLASKT